MLGRPPKNEEELSVKMFSIIQARQSITLRELTRQFSTTHHRQIEAMCKLAAQYGTLQLTGTGRKGSPFTVRLKDAALRPTVPEA